MRERPAMEPIHLALKLSLFTRIDPQEEPTRT